MNLDDIKIDIANKFKSVYYVDEMLGTYNGKTKYFRIDIMNLMTYKQLLNAGVMFRKSIAHV
jgi:hypothetical protein